MKALARGGATGLCASVLLWACLPQPSAASAYNGRPRLIVILVIDQFREDYLERYRDRFTEGGFRLFLERGAYFPDCNYDYANTRTAPGHATLLTGAYSNGHGIMANEWWDAKKKKMVTSVEDDATHLVGIEGSRIGASPQNLLASTLGDELKLATEGKARVFGMSLKDRAAVLAAGHAADGAYWIDHKSGAWVTSTYFRSELPKWVADFNASKRTSKYWDREWTDTSGATLRSTAHRKNQDGSEADFYEVVGATPFANDYEFEFARELVLYEHLGTGPATDLLTIGLSANDILGHQVGPDSPAMESMILDTDRQLADFFSFLGHQVGLANVWMALAADHGVAPLPSLATKLHLLGANLNAENLQSQINKLLAGKLSPGRTPAFIEKMDYPLAWLNDEAFAALKIKEADAERLVGEVMKQEGFRGYFTRAQLAEGAVPDTDTGRKYLNSYSSEGGWLVMGVPAPFSVGVTEGTNHGSPYSYDTHVPLALYGLAFQTGTYYTHVEPVDLAVTLAALLGINAPTHAVGRVLKETIAPAHHGENPPSPPEKPPKPPKPSSELKPASLSLPGEGRP
ncbi:MAG TPA: alkaline phosphatase family protein [Terriglobales bacterium]|nr:alkaline phosphatase family protein [Terriglobales bacterium]